MEGIQIKDLPVISNKKGDILKGFMKSTNLSIDVKEVYFSEIHPNEIKAWKMHKIMTCNLIVVHGEIKIVIQKNLLSGKSVRTKLPFLQQSKKSNP